jgi:predicted  nucleic acid-binding Zn-ribbon protein
MSHKKKNVSTAHIVMFPDNAILPNSSPSKNALITALTHKTEELRVGGLDYDRWRPLLKEIRIAGNIKHSNRAKVNGNWYDVRFMKYLLKFMDNWKSRAAQLEWEINEIRKSIEDLERQGQ